ncbi:MAG: J domain-containing protein [Chthoniobacterales bacterium]
MAVQYRDYYKTLGVAKTATQDEIRSAFRKLARKHHPDTAADKATAEEKFKEINEAYEVLGDAEKRRKYDEYGANWEQAGQGGGGFSGGGFARGGQPGGGFDFGGGGVEYEFDGTGFSDFFEQMFGARRSGGRPAGGGMGGGFGGAYGQGPQRGGDVEADMMVTLEEAFEGSSRQISFRRDGAQQTQTYTVKIPKGVRDGQKIRLAGQGSPGTSGAAAGDLFLRMKIQKHPYFEVEGSDLRVEVEVPVATCVLGGETEVRTLEGRAKIRLKEGTPNGMKMRLGGRGLPKPDGGRGDLFVTIHALLPTTVPDADRPHWEALAGQ